MATKKTVKKATKKPAKKAAPKAAKLAKKPTRKPATKPAKKPATKAAPESSAEVAALLAKIAANLDDDAPRAALADLFDEQGDPRGELIHDQLANPKQMTCAGASKHLTSWLGDLAEIVHPHHLEFVRGFPRDVTLSSLAKVEQMNAHAGNPLFATVERLDLDGASKLPTELLEHPVMKNVTHLGMIASSALTELLAWTTIPYTSLGLTFHVDDKQARALIDARSKLKALRRLAFEVFELDSCDWMLDSWLGTELEEIGLYGGLDRIPAWLAFVRDREPVPRVVLGNSYDRVSIAIERNDDGLVLTARMDPTGLSKALIAVPPDLVAVLRVTRAGDKRQRGVLENVARRMRAKFEVLA